MQLPRPIRGIIPPLATPLIDERTLDIEGLARLVEHHIEGGVHGLFALGTTSEAPSISPELRHQVIERVCDQVAGRIPVLVGITDTSYAVTMDLAETALSAGAAAVVAAPPYYMPISQRELRAYFERLAVDSPLPLLLYNIPVCTKTAIEFETVCALRDVPNIIGVKDSSGDLDLFGRIVQATQDDELFTVLIGPEQMLPEAMALGGHGGVCGGANMFPELYVRLYDACVAGDSDLQSELHQQVLRISSDIYGSSDDPFAFVKTSKFVLHRLGICSGFAAPPFAPLTEEEQSRLATAVDALIPVLT